MCGSRQRGTVTEVVTTIPDGVVSQLNLIVALKHQVGVEQQRELVKVQLAVKSESPVTLFGNWHMIFCHMVGITHEGMGASAQVSLALDHFIQALPDPDLRAHLSV